jgi:hypothetical protein
LTWKSRQILFRILMKLTIYAKSIVICAQVILLPNELVFQLPCKYKLKALSLYKSIRPFECKFCDQYDFYDESYFNKTWVLATNEKKRVKTQSIELKSQRGFLKLINILNSFCFLCIGMKTWIARQLIYTEFKLTQKRTASI